MAKVRPVPDVLDVVTWNAKVGRYPVAVAWNLRRLIRHTTPDVVALEEAGAYVDLLRATFAGWRVIRLHSDIVLMVRRTLPTPDDVEVLGHDRPWTGPKAGIVHHGRKHLLTRLGGHAILFVHRVTGGPSGPNRKVYGIESELIGFALADLGACACLGDQNATVDELADAWRALGMRPIRTGSKVHHGAERGYDAHGHKLDRMYGSDSYPVKYRLRLTS